MPHAHETGKNLPGLPGPADMEILALVSLLASYFARARQEMPPELASEFKRHDLTPRHGALLAQLVPGQQIGVSELARRLGLSLSTVSELAGRLADAGLIERREDPANRRRTLLSLHEHHRARFEAFIARRMAPLLRAMDHLTPTERAGFLAGLTAWAHEAEPAPVKR